MDDSQSSDIFSETSGNLNYTSTIQIEKYEVLVSKIKDLPLKSVSIKNFITSEHFSVLLEDCRLCVFQSLKLIISTLEDTNIQINKLCGYIADAVCILQVLTHFVKTIIESVASTCRTVNNFSTCTGDIILFVFTHCKNSECIYTNNLCMVENYLKELFRNCHELQLSYLIALEKHLLFDLTEKEDQHILVKTLELNLQIGDVVQSLDVKTMAEQWKAYTMICEKYSTFLLEKNIFNTTSELLASTIEKNINTAVEANEEDKIVLRSLKVANFALKILLRMCNIFKSSANNNFENIIRLLLNISLCNNSYYEITANKSSQFSDLLDTHISLPSEIIVASLVNEEQFLKLIFLTDRNELSDTHLLGYLLLVIMIIKALLEKENAPNENKDKVIASVFTLLPYCHKWFNIGLKFKHTSAGKAKHYGLYEHLLLHTVALSNRMAPEQYCKLENRLYEALLGTEYYSAIFASNLWVLLCRLSNEQLQFEVLLGLLRVYQKLETHAQFPESPQRIHLRYTIESLYRTLNHERMHIYKQFSMKDEKNFGIWSALKIRNVQNDVPKSINDAFACLDEVLNSRDGSLIQYLKLLSTYSFLERNSMAQALLIRAWQKVCPNCCIQVSQMKLNDPWRLRYLEALASLTDSYMELFEETSTLVNILTIISNILHIGNNDALHLLFKLFCKLSNYLIDKQKDGEITTLLTNTTSSLLEESDFQQYIFNNMVSDDNISKLIRPVLKESKELWDKFVVYKNKFIDRTERHQQLGLVANNKYIHKCIEIADIDVQESTCKEINDNIQAIGKTKSNFDLGDIDSLFEESDEEPVSKKAKLDFDVDNLIGKIESDVDLLSQVKENVLGEYKDRIKCVCDKLRNILS